MAPTPPIPLPPIPPPPVTPPDALSRVLMSFSRYYNIERGEVEAPFAAEAVFHSHEEQYFLTKRAKLAEAESNEYVFFATVDLLDRSEIERLDKAAWERGLSRVSPHPDHRNTDIALVVLAREITPDAREFISHSKHYKSYYFTFQGWSHYRLVALEASTGELLSNRHGKDLARLLRNSSSAGANPKSQNKKRR